MQQIILEQSPLERWNQNREVWPQSIVPCVQKASPGYQHKHLKPAVKHGAGGGTIRSCFARLRTEAWHKLGYISGEAVYQELWAKIPLQTMEKTDRLAENY